jgi:hypothetical protein
MVSSVIDTTHIVNLAHLFTNDFGAGASSEKAKTAGTVLIFLTLSLFKSLKNAKKPLS